MKVLRLGTWFSGAWFDTAKVVVFDEISLILQDESRCCFDEISALLKRWHDYETVLCYGWSMRVLLQGRIICHGIDGDRFFVLLFFVKLPL